MLLVQWLGLSMTCVQVSEQLHVVERLLARLVDRNLLYTCLQSTQGEEASSAFQGYDGVTRLVQVSCCHQQLLIKAQWTT